jgi:hypothetical protein
MKKLQLALGMTLGCLVAMGCKEVKISNGKIPDEQIHRFLKPYEGSFVGTVKTKSLTTASEGFQTKLLFSIDERDHKVMVKSESDLVADGCNSKIGNLKSIEFHGDGNSGDLYYAVFDFDPGACARKVQGREAVFYFGNMISESDVTFFITKEHKIMGPRNYQTLEIVGRFKPVVN